MGIPNRAFSQVFAPRESAGRADSHSPASEIRSPNRRTPTNVRGAGPSEPARLGYGWYLKKVTMR